MMLFQTIVVLSVFWVVLLIFLIKKRNVLTAQIKELNRYQQFAVICVLVVAVANGGSKVTPPGPTKANLKILLAERARKKLSSGQEYGDKETYREGLALTDSATAAVASVENSLPAISNAVTQSSQEVATSLTIDKHYFRLVFPSPVLSEDSNLYGEVKKYTVTNGILKAYVWFNMIPNTEPNMCFTFATGTATNHLETLFSSHSSFPDTTIIDGFSCFEYYTPIPPVLLSDSKLIAPLDFSKEIAFGCPEMEKPFNIDGGIAIYWEGQYWVGVTGWRTNVVDNVAYYYYNGMLSDPPATSQGEGNNNEEF